ncbi:tryptophan ABC transporter substrate-binding protein [Lapidilactobacillus mulanensis]|uniref:Tryptophan ABC transporter substrate-binding protein n=1 Tax=Lapidilactobacillus mulanensis TaxID=2485999 RepID=A0ABW4DNF7_9LACO|nr:tryptophan ABC transporter substrate-binding protein [Lapidilactobacillus mulanensis]
MMKRMIAFISALIVFLGFAFFYSNQPKQATAKHIPTIGLLQLQSHPALDEIHQGFVAGLKSEGYTPGKNIKIDFQNAQADQSNLKTMSSKFVNEKVDLMAAIATPAAQAEANAANGKTPIILAGITDPVGGKLIKSDKRPGNNITGTSGESPLPQLLKLMQELVPTAKTVGIIYSSSDHGGEYNATKFEKLAKAAGLTCKMYTISNTNDMQQVAQKMVSEVDVVYAPQDNGVASAMKTLTNVANKEKKPIIASADTMVKDGGLASYAIKQFDLGKVAGQMAARVLNGRSTKTYPIAYVLKGNYVINEKEAKLLGIEIPAHIMQGAKDKGEIFK